MPVPFIEPSGHKKPHRRGQLFNPGLFEPEDYRQATGYLVATMAFCGFAIVLAFGVGNHVQWWIPLLYLLCWIPLMSCLGWLILIKSTEWHRRAHVPQVARFVQSKDGRALLVEGDALHKRRERLMEDSNSPYPLLVQEVARCGIDATTKGSCVQAYDVAWQEQLRLERDLRERQDRFLSGSSSAT